MNYWWNWNMNADGTRIWITILIWECYIKTETSIWNMALVRMVTSWKQYWTNMPQRWTTNIIVQASLLMLTATQICLKTELETLRGHWWKNYILRNIFEILLNQTEIRLYLPFSDWFGTANGRCLFAVPNQAENGIYNLISVWFNKTSKRFLCV